MDDLSPDPDAFEPRLAQYLEDILVLHFSPGTCQTRKCNLKHFARWCAERGILRPSEVTRPVIERYRRYMFYKRKPGGAPYAMSTHCQRFTDIRQFFRWLARKNLILHNPAADLESMRREKRLPRAILTLSDIEKIFSLPDVRTPQGARDRAILETLYSTGLRRSELIQLMISDVDHERGVVVVRLGKGKKDRVVPIGERALVWIRIYMERGRPRFVVPPDDGHIFLSARGVGISRNQLSLLVRRYVLRAKLGKTGSCHLFRHSCATHMHENGGDIRFIQAMLGHEDITSTEIYTRVGIHKLKLVHTSTHPTATLDRRPAHSQTEEEIYI